jgi:hypothetical protein
MKDAGKYKVLLNTYASQVYFDRDIDFSQKECQPPEISSGGFYFIQDFCLTGTLQSNDQPGSYTEVFPFLRLFVI